MITRFSYGVFWSLLGAVGSRLSSLATIIITARLLGKEGFGELAMVQSSIGLLGIFAGFGLGFTTTKYVAELKGKDPSRAGRIIGLANLTALISGSFMAVAFMALAPWLASKTLNAPHLAPLLQLCSPLLLVSAFLGVQTGTLSGLQAFRAIARINVGQALITLPVTLMLVYFLGLSGAVLSLSASALAGVIMSSITLRSECAASSVPLDYRNSWDERHVLWNFSLPYVLTCSMNAPVIWAANAVLVNQPNGYAELGLFNAANQFRLLIMFLPTFIGMVTVPLLSEIHGGTSPEHFAPAVNANLRTIWGLALPCSLLFIGTSSWLMGLFGPQFQGGQFMLSLIICVTIVQIPNAIIGQTLISSGRMWAGLLMNVGWAVVFLLLVVYLTPLSGAKGLAVSYLLSYGCHTLWELIYSKIKFSKNSIKYSPTLMFLTLLIIIFAQFAEYIPNALFASLSVLFGIVTGIYCWRILPVQGKQKILELVTSIPHKLP